MLGGRTGARRIVGRHRAEPATSARDSASSHARASRRAGAAVGDLRQAPRRRLDVGASSVTARASRARRFSGCRRTWWHEHGARCQPHGRYCVSRRASSRPATAARGVRDLLDGAHSRAARCSRVARPRGEAGDGVGEVGGGHGGDGLGTELGRGWGPGLADQVHGPTRRAPNPEMSRRRGPPPHRMPAGTGRSSRSAALAARRNARARPRVSRASPRGPPQARAAHVVRRPPRRVVARPPRAVRARWAQRARALRRVAARRARVTAARCRQPEPHMRLSPRRRAARS